MAHNVFGIFTYEQLEETEDGMKLFTDCTFLRQVGKYQKGDKIHSLSLNLDMYIWDEKGDLLDSVKATVT
jgi:hypothetical protein